MFCPKIWIFLNPFLSKIVCFFIVPELYIVPEKNKKYTKKVVKIILDDAIMDTSKGGLYFKANISKSTTYKYTGILLLRLQHCY